jgi:non-lysosomal glucosylceramidase
MERPGFCLASIFALILPFLIGPAVLPASPQAAGAPSGPWNDRWPVLRFYDRDHIERISLPLGGIGTGTVGLGGRGNLVDWEIMNRPAKGYTPFTGQQLGPFFAIFVRPDGGAALVRALEGPLPLSVYEASHGSTAINHGLPRFRDCSFAAAYPLGQVLLSDPEMPVDVRIEAFNPLIPGEPDESGFPAAALRYVVLNKTPRPIHVAICGSLPNFIGADGSNLARDWKNDPVARGPKRNRNEFRRTDILRGILMTSAGVDPKDEAWGTIALATRAREGTSRTSWLEEGWGAPLLDFWDDFGADGRLEERAGGGEDMPFASLAGEVDVPASGSAAVTFLLSWHFPNRRTWTPKGNAEDIIGNYYTTRWNDAWQALEAFAARLDGLETRTLEFVRAFAKSTLPAEVKEAALFNLSTLRTQTCFRTPDGRFFGFEGSSNGSGCCYGSCTHVWNYEQATAFLFGSLARSMRETEFLFATDADGLMSFRVGLPLIPRARDFGKAAADGQMGCIMKVFRDWKLSGDDGWLERLWPQVKKALAFAWIKGGWDANRDGVMEGCQHNTMDVEYYGPNPQMEVWYLGALRAAEEMAGRLGDAAFRKTCRTLFENGRAWTDAHLWNGEYYEHEVRPPASTADIAPSLLVGMGAKDVREPDYQLGKGCLVDQLVGQFMAHVCGLGYLLDERNVRTTLRTIVKNNRREGFDSHFNCLRSFVLGDESALLMASYPKGRPRNPFPYFTEVMTGFEYAAGVGMLYEGDVENGLRTIRDIRERYDGKKRSPFDEAECGHHYARAMASWAAVLALSGFQYSGAEKTMEFAAREGTYFWSNGSAWGTCRIASTGGDAVKAGAGKPGFAGELTVLHGRLELAALRLRGAGEERFKTPKNLNAGESLRVKIPEPKAKKESGRQPLKPSVWGVEQRT